MKIIELTIDNLEDEGGLDGIALVERPAHESNFFWFKSEEDKPIYEILTPEEMLELAIQLNLLGEKHQDLVKEGWVLQSIEDIKSPMDFASVNIISDPNAESGEDSLGAYRVRYRYVGPEDDKNRTFCAEMMKQKRVFRREDIDAMSEAISNPEFGRYSIWDYRGSYNCRHYWQKLTYKYEGRIVNKDTIKVGRTGIEDIPNEITQNRATINKALERQQEKELKKVESSYEFSVLDVIDNMPVFSTEQEAIQFSEIIGCSGFHTHDMGNGVVGYMACEKHLFESYNDYPKAASENACKVLRWIDEHGRDEVSGMEMTGLARANQLCKGENISRETISRMASFERHRKNSEIDPQYEGTPWKDKGYVSWLGWGGDEGISWAQNKLQELEREEMLYENPCQSGYIAYGTKIKDGKKVPNCVEMTKMESQEDCGCKEGYVSDGFSCIPVDNSNMTFSTDDDKMEITGAAMIPNKLIIRKSPPTFDNPRGELYYVFFTEETIRKLAEKFMMEKRLDQTNIEHTGVDADTYVKESWIVEDPEKDKSAALGLHYPKGTWVITSKVKSPRVWEKVKKGVLNGYSVEGWFKENLLFS